MPERISRRSFRKPDATHVAQTRLLVPVILVAVARDAHLHVASGAPRNRGANDAGRVTLPSTSPATGPQDVATGVRISAQLSVTLVAAPTSR